MTILSQHNLVSGISRPTFVCWKSTMETPKQCMNPVQSFEYRHRMTSLTSSWCLYCCLCTNFSHSSGVSIVDFEQVNVRWMVYKFWISKFLVSTFSENICFKLFQICILTVQVRHTLLYLTLFSYFTREDFICFILF